MIDLEEIGDGSTDLFCEEAVLAGRCSDMGSQGAGFELTWRSHGGGDVGAKVIEERETIQRGK